MFHFSNVTLRRIDEGSVPVRVSQGILPRKMIKIEVLGSGISGIPRPSQGVIAQSLAVSGFDRTPVDPPQ